MTLVKNFCIFLLLFGAYNYYVDCEEQKLLKYICDLGEKVLTADVDTKDVAIGSINSKLPADLIDGITACISKHSMVILSDYKKAIKHENLRKASVVILLTDNFVRIL